MLFKRLTYKQDKYSGAVLPPDIFLVNKKLERIGKLYPIENPQVVTNYNAANEISFSYPKEINGKATQYYENLSDLCVIEADNHFYEIAVSINDVNGTLSKSISGISLGYAELSQRIITLDVNTPDDILRPDYVPAILYNPDYSPTNRSSLIHRILSYAPDYTIGHVDRSIAYLQRTFSWSDCSIDSCFNDISQELECIFDIEVARETDDYGNVVPVRRINIYDTCYCSKCLADFQNGNSKNGISGDFWRDIIDDKCQTCGSSEYIKQLGEDTTITVNTKNLSDEIKVQTDKDKIKNCFKLKAGDELMTNVIQGLNISGSNKIMMFSPEQLSLMTSELQKRWTEYVEKVSDPNLNKKYEDLVNMNYNTLELILYLESGKMPTLDTTEGTVNDLWSDIYHGLDAYGRSFFIGKKTSNTKSSDARAAIKSFLTTFLYSGYTLKEINTTGVSDDFGNNDGYYWYGNYRIEYNQNKNTYIDVSLNEHGISVDIYDNGTLTERNYPQKYSIVYGLKKESESDYEKYILQNIDALLKSDDILSDADKEPEFSKYSLNRLTSYIDGYTKCLNVLEEKRIASKAEFDSPNNEAEFYKKIDSVINNLKQKYERLCTDAQNEYNIVSDQLFILYYILGDQQRLAEKYPPLKYGETWHYTFLHFLQFNNNIEASKQTILSSLVSNMQSCNKGVQCLNCGSTNVSYDSSTNTYYCNNTKFCVNGNVITYYDYAKSLYDYYYNNSDTSLDVSRTILGKLGKIRRDCDIETNIGTSLYQELCTFLREDVYENSNYISENLDSNVALINNAKKYVEAAKKELAKACISQISITSDLASLVVQDSIKPQIRSIEHAYDKFLLGNFIHAIVDDFVYKLRVIAITYDYETVDKIQVTFANVTRSLLGSLSDLEDILAQSQSMATSFNTIAKQAENGEAASKKFDHIKQQGLDSALGFVNAAKDMSVIIDDKGILLRRFENELDDYDRHQMKITDRNIVMTDDYWETARMAIGLGLYNNKLYYGVWADLLVGNIIAGKWLNISNDNGSVQITGDGITIAKGTIKWDANVNAPEISDINNLSSTIDKARTDAEQAAKEYTDNFQKKVDFWTSKICGTTTEIGENYIFSPMIGGGYGYWTNGYYSVEIDPNHSTQDERTKDGYLFCIRDKRQSSNDIIMGVDINGKGIFKGSVITDGSFNGGSILIGGTTGNVIVGYDGVQAIYETQKKQFKVDEQGNTELTTLKVNGTIEMPLIRKKDGFDDHKGLISINKYGMYQVLDAIHDGYNWIECGASYSSASIYMSRGNVPRFIVNNSIDENGGKLYFNGNRVDLRVNNQIYLTSQDIFISADKGTNGFSGITLTTPVVLEQNTTSHYVGYSYSVLNISGGIALQNNDGSALIFARAFNSDTERALLIGDYYNLRLKSYGEIGLHSNGAITFNTPSVTVNGAGIQTTSDIRLKKDFTDLNDYEDFFYHIEPTAFKYTNGTSDRYHVGFKAQQISQSLADSHMDTKAFGGYVYHEQSDSYYLRYDEFIALNTHMIQKLYKELNHMKDVLNESGINYDFHYVNM